MNSAPIVSDRDVVLPPAPAREYEVHAVRIGRVEMPVAECFAGYDPADAGRLTTLDYYFWVVRGENLCLLFDTGFSEGGAARRHRTMLTSPEEGLGELGLTPDDVDTVVVSHCHYDHIGNLDLFPRARLVVQGAELDFWWRIQSLPQRDLLTRLVDAEDIAQFAEAASGGRLTILDGDRDLAPGIGVRLFGGHTPGSQILTVQTPSTELVLASDALHFYDELDSGRPFAAFVDLDRTYDAFDVLRSERTRTAVTVVPGHDPRVMDRFHAGADGQKASVELSRGEPTSSYGSEAAGQETMETAMEDN